MRGSRFYCLNHSTRVLESNHAVYFEGQFKSESQTPCIIPFGNEQEISLVIENLSIMPLLTPLVGSSQTILQNDLVQPVIQILENLMLKQLVDILLVIALV